MPRIKRGEQNNIPSPRRHPTADQYPFRFRIQPETKQRRCGNALRSNPTDAFIITDDSSAWDEDKFQTSINGLTNGGEAESRLPWLRGFIGFGPYPFVVQFPGHRKISLGPNRNEGGGTFPQSVWRTIHEHRNPVFQKPPALGAMHVHIFPHTGDPFFGSFFFFPDDK